MKNQHRPSLRKLLIEVVAIVVTGVSLVSAGWYARTFYLNYLLQTELSSCEMPPNFRRQMLLVASGADVNTTSREGSTLLMGAAVYGRSDIISELLARRADIHRRDSSGLTALHYAACFGSVESTRLLVESGADVNAVSPTGATPLAGAVVNNDLASVELLLSRGADSSPRFKHRTMGRVTALDFARRKGFARIVACLERRMRQAGTCSR